MEIAFRRGLIFL
jgi:hypothetical protein